MNLRVTNETQLMQAQQNLQLSSQRLNQLTQEASSGIAITLPSDNPTGAAEIMQIQQELSQNTQYQTNAQNGTGWLSTIDTTMSAVNNNMTQLRDLVLQAANGTNNSTSEQSIVDQMNTIKQSLMSLANTQYLGRNVFAGTSDSSTAFNADYSYNGTPGATVDRRVGPSTTVTVSADGSQIFGTGSNSVFSLIDTITGDITAGTNPSSELSSIDTFMTGMQGAQASVGAAEDQLQSATSQLTTAATSLQSSQSQVQDANPSTTILEMETQQVAYQTALQVTAKSLQPTLMEYLQN